MADSLEPTSSFSLRCIIMAVDPEASDSLSWTLLARFRFELREEVRTGEKTCGEREEMDRGEP